MRPEHGSNWQKRLLLGIFGLAVAGALAYPFLPVSKFPYVGVWGYPTSQSDGTRMEWFYAFHEDGSCSVLLRYPARPAPNRVNSSSCQYRMEGESALVSYKMSGLTVTDWKIADNVVTLKGVVKLTPKDQGKHVLFEPQKWTYTNRSGQTLTGAGPKMSILMRRAHNTKIIRQNP